MKRLLISIMVYFIRKDFGANCPDYDESCASCQAKKCIEFLNEYKELLK